jgi:voltage-gated potassium channel
MGKIKKVIDMGFDFKHDYKYPLFLIALLSFFFLPSFFSEEVEPLLDMVFFAALIVTSILLMESKSKIRKGIVILTGVLGMLIGLSNVFFEISRIYRVAEFFLLFIMFLLLFQELIAQIFRTATITLNVVLGAFTGYIMIGIIGYFIILIIYFLNPEAYRITEHPINDLLYYSFITLSTIGYGDISPLTLPGKNIAVIIGLVGQFYIAFIMAVIIGKFLQAENT